MLTLEEIEALQAKHLEEKRAHDKDVRHVETTCRLIAQETERACNAIFAPTIAALANAITQISRG
jgi:hypothetical protein